MHTIRFLLTLFILAFFSFWGYAQNRQLITEPCEGCEAVFEYHKVQPILHPVDTLPDFNNEGQKLKLTGTIYKKDGITPAKGVILYIYHTDQKGIYATKGNETGWGKRHGYIRGWIKTGADGRYTFYTLLPGHYPDRSSPRHIHPLVLEPDGKYYYINEWHFSGDPYLTAKEIKKEPYGGSGLVTLRKEGDLWVAERDIILGLNISNYSDDE